MGVAPIPPRTDSDFYEMFIKDKLHTKANFLRSCSENTIKTYSQSSPLTAYIFMRLYTSLIVFLLADYCSFLGHKSYYNNACRYCIDIVHFYYTHNLQVNKSNKTVAFHDLFTKQLSNKITSFMSCDSHKTS